VQSYLAIEEAEARGRVLAFARSLTRENRAHAAMRTTSGLNPQTEKCAPAGSRVRLHRRRREQRPQPSQL
jgi:hypothetical protein